jgi:hypothetical protein
MRPTADIDVLESKGTDLTTLAKLAGRTSPLYKRHGVYIDVVTVADVPDNYDERLTTALDASFEKLQFRIFEKHDLVLAKIVRNNDRDRADVVAIAGGPGLEIDVLRGALRRGAPAKAWQAGTRRPHAQALDRDHRRNQAAPAGLTTGLPGTVATAIAR